MVHVFVYGTLMPGASNYRVCSRFIVESQPAIALGNLYALPLGYPAMTTGKRWIQGYKLRLSDASALNLLDNFEQHNPRTFGQHYPHLKVTQHQYNRREIEVYDLHQRSLGYAWSYQMEPTQVQWLNGVRLSVKRWSWQHHQQALQARSELRMRS